MLKFNATVSIEKISPEMAKVMLENVIGGQRILREYAIKQLAKEMRMGRFRLSSDAILFVRGSLANGQHRLMAVIQSALAQLFIVMRTSDKKVYDVIDCGLSRSIGDVLNQDRISYSKVIASISRLVVLYDKRLLTRQGHSWIRPEKNGEYREMWTRGDTIEYARSHQDSLMKTSKFVVELYDKKRILTKSMAGALIEITSRKYPGKGEEFIEKIFNGTSSDDAAFDMRERLIRMSIERIHRPARSYIFGLLIKSFKAYIHGDRIETLKIGEREEYPKI